MTQQPTPLAKTYDPVDTEQRLYDWWEKQGFFRADPGDDGAPFCIVIPLPNITGSLHLGHALNHSLQDALIRRARMQGRSTLWQPGTDHAGIATQNVVERQLADEGLSRHDLGRDAFVERVWRWKEESGGLILRQMRRLGASPDWDREAFTLDETRSKAVREVFVSLYESGRIYRGNRLINWCPRCATALSDIEVDHYEEEGELAHLRYPATGGGDGVVVATTRVETMLGDTAVAVHPDDERYRDLIGQSVRLPLLDRELPVIADAHVDPEFGTGAVKVTPAHDPNDYEIGKRHGLDFVDIMTDEATISEAGGPYAGLDRYEARERVKADLDQLGLLERVEPYTHSVGHCSRCDTIVEPRLSDQWFVAVAPLAAPAAEAVRANRTRFVPERNTKGFLDWLDNLHDWCISRQLWWGHRIPVWYDRDGSMHVLREDPSPEEVERLGLEQDPDVLDTWFSSALWPFSTQGWTGSGSDTPELRTWYPGTVLVTGYDINTFWVSRMMMMGLEFMDEVPFHAVLNHGLVRDKHGKKMSKSFGNVIDPLDLMDAYGADALRFALLRAAIPGHDVPLAEEWVEGAKRFCNKLWNAARFVFAELGDVTTDEGLPGEPALEDRWILSRLEAARSTVDAAYEDYDLATASKALYHFVWDEYCDWYLELAKLRDDRGARQVLATVLDQALRLLHPVVPFVTEEIWQALHRPGEQQALMIDEWPSPAPERRDERAEREFGAVQEAVTELRRFRADHGLSPAQRVTVHAVVEPSQAQILESGRVGICRLAGVEQWTFDGEVAGPTGKVPVAGGQLLVPLAGLIDLDEERGRIERELAKAHDEVERARRKLANEAFVSKAPEAVVQAERDKVAEWSEATERLEEQRAAFD